MKIEMTEKMIVSYHRVSPTKVDRVSTDGLKLTHSEIQKNIHKSMLSSIETCERAAASNGEKIDKIYTDEYVSGKNQAQMLKFKEMMDDVRDGKISKIYVRRVNRFGRNTKQSLESIIELDSLGVTVIFVENGIDSSKPFMIPIIAMFVELAQQERENWEEARTKGIADAKKAGVKFGQPKKDVDVEMLRLLRTAPIDKRPTWKACEEKFNCSRTTLIRALKAKGYWDYTRGCAQ